MRRPWCATVRNVLLVGLATSQCACPVIAWFTAQFGPKEKVAAKFDPPKDKRMLVFVDDILSPVVYEPIKIELTRRLNELFVEHKVARETVSYDRLADLIMATPDFNRLAVSQVGQKVGADTVLYLHIDRFSLHDRATEELWKGRLQVTVRLTDVEKGRLWPKDREAGYLVDEVETPTRVTTSDTTADEITQELAARMADRIAKLFYEHERPHEGAWSGD
ncbi:MAG TPA: hypothetical protein VM695_13360 [Phycisphaerae bacterium]|nr:hypothetical protein [Phycisphaerae bacterium]